MLTRRQSEVLAVITTLMKKGYAPSYEEIMRASRLRSLSPVAKHVYALERKGCLVFRLHQSRSIELIPEVRRNGKAWRYCDRDHAPVLYQAASCPCCEFVDAAALA